MDRKYCVFGDSITHASYIKSSWVNLLRECLEDKYSGDNVNVFNLGINGNTTDDVLKRFSHETDARNPGFLIFQIGINDSGYFRTPDKPIVNLESYKSNLETIISKAQQITNDITFLGLALGDDSLLNPYPESERGKTYKKERTLNYDKILKEISEANNCKYIKLSEILKPSDFSDGLHPNEEGHKKIFESLKDHL